MKRIAVIHGPNLNLLGLREPHVYRSPPLGELNDGLVKLGSELGVVVSTMQSNHEGAIIDHIHGLLGNAEGVVINAGALTHTSVGVRDALLGVALPFVEVHLSNVYKREAFRHHSMLSDVAVGVICGFGAQSYALGLRAIVAALG